jgi:ATP-dependent DNA ligase
VVFDGELVFMDTDWYQYRDRKTGNGLGNKAIKGTLSAKEAQYACVELWDVIKLDDFEAGFCSVPYSTRFGELSCAVALLEQKPTRIRVAQTESAQNQDEILEIYSRHLSYGHEGVIVKEYKLTWQPDRVKNQIKLKNESVCELRVVGVQPGIGKYEGMIGALLCESEDGVIKVSVGSGLKDGDRLTDVYTGKIVSVKYNERITNKAGEQSLFLPIFHQLREDKDVADVSTMIE